MAERNEQLEELAAANAALEAAKQEACKVLKDAVAAHRTEAEGLRAQITAAEVGDPLPWERLVHERKSPNAVPCRKARLSTAEHPNQPTGALGDGGCV